MLVVGAALGGFFTFAFGNSIIVELNSRNHCGLFIGFSILFVLCMYDDAVAPKRIIGMWQNMLNNAYSPLNMKARSSKNALQ